MYNFELLKGEETIAIFDDVYIRQEKNEKETSIVLTNKRMLFLDYDKYDSREILRIGRNSDYLRYKEVYYQFNLSDIKEIILNEIYKVILKNGTNFEFDNKDLYKLLKENIK